PILIDISTSITTAALTARRRAQGQKMPGQWLLSPFGMATDDPDVLDSGGSLLPVGGVDHGHKGYALGVLVRCVTQGLCWPARADKPGDWGASVLVLAFSPAFFDGQLAFRRQVNWLASACHASRPIADAVPVRLPGEAALERAREAALRGVPLAPATV